METTPLDIASLRNEYAAHGLRRGDLAPDPIHQFASWFSAAVAAGIPDVNAMSLATTNRDCHPSVRIVLLKGFDEWGLTFFTNYASEKGTEMEVNAHVALVFYWVQLERQVRVTGTVEKTSRAESLAYFHSRPRGSQLGAWASRQSEVVDARRVLDARLAEMEERFESREVELPAHWGGYRVHPDKVEFWQGRPNRMHDRFRYSRSEGAWAIERLAP